MGIISTFDPRFKKQLLEKSKEEFWEWNVVYIKKSHLFLCVKVLLPFILWFSVLVTLITCAILYIPWTWLRINTCVIVIWAFAAPGYKILKYFLDYEMDFAVVTPKSFLRYNQTWFFKRSSKAIDMKHIRSVYVRKAWFFNSIFNNWHIIVLTEWSAGNPKEDWNNPWEVEFRYVYHPEYYSNRIQKLLENIQSDND
jgi:hypothetical protein